jgi:peroxiredoxin-like protein
MTLLHVKWNGLTTGSGIIEAEKMALPIAIPEHFGGTGQGANPKELLAASAASCYLMTLAAMLEGHKIPASIISLTTELKGDKPSNMLIAHNVEVKLGEARKPEEDKNVMALIQKADHSCMIGNLIKQSGVDITVLGVVIH